MNPVVEQAGFGSILQIQSLALRLDILRKPLGLEFDPTELLNESDQDHWIARVQGFVVGCMLYKPLGDGLIKMRQVAVHPQFQRNSVGTEMVVTSEKYYLQKGNRKIDLHARESAVKFYLNLGYQINGDRFIEVGIPHYKMSKHLSDN